MKKKRKLGRKLLSFLLTLAMLVGLMPGMSLTAYAASNTVTWNPSDIVPEHPLDDSFTKDGITITAGSCDFQELTFRGGGTFTTTLGNFTKIEISADYAGDVSGTGWSNDGWQSATWTGDAASVSFSGDIWGGGMTCDGGNLTIKFTIEVSTVDVTGVTLNPSAAQTIDVDGTVSFTAAVAPDNATDKTVKWSVGGTNTDAVTLYSDEACETAVTLDTATETLTVYAKGISAGSATVTATSNADSTRTASCDVTVNTPALDPVPYMAWNGTTLVEKTGDDACTDYTVVAADTTTFEDGKWYVVSNSVTVSNRITATGTANLILCDGATLTASKGITVNSGNTINIYAQIGGTGELNAGSDTSVASIGGGYRGASSGTVNIHGGKVTATGGSNASGIGGALEGGNGEVNIYSGEVTARGKNYAAGIGGYTGKSGGTVNIYGGTVNASGSQYGTTGIGIGGKNPGNCVVHIYGGEVTATSEKAAAGIQGTVTIDGGTVTANGGVSDAIDCSSGETYSSNGINGTVTVNGGTVTASGGNVTANSYMGAIESYGGTIYACSGINGTVTISGGTVTATGGNVTGDINNYRDGTIYACNGVSGTMTISGGTVTATGGSHTGNSSGTTVKEKGFGGSLTLGTGMYLYGGTSANPESNLSNYRAGAGDYTGDRYVYMTVNNVVPHIHSFTYTATGATITAACTAGCDITEGLALTISAPTELTYDGSAKAATLSTGYNTTAFPGEYMIKYYKGANEVEAANVKAAGDYTAKVTVGEATASVDFTIAKATPSIETIPTASAVTYGQKLADSTLTGGTGSVAGGFAWKDSTVAPTVSDSQNTEYDVVFTPTDENYDAAECKVKLTVNKADSAVTTAPTAKTLTYNGSAQSLINAGTASGGTMKYAVTTANQEPAAEAYTFDNTSLPTSTNAGTYYVWYKVVADDNHIDSDPESIEVVLSKLTAKLKWTETSLTYDGTEKKPVATVSNLADNDDVSVTVTGGKTDVGIYSATATELTGNDAGNYEISTDDSTCFFSIVEADVDISVSMEGWTYGETPNDPVVNVSKEGLAYKVEYKPVSSSNSAYSEGKPVSAGTYNVRARITDSKYSKIIASDTFTISPIEVELNWGVTEFVYTGKDQCPTVELNGVLPDDKDDVEATVVGAATAVGDHTARVTRLTGTAAANYKLPENTSTTFTIDKASIDDDKVEVKIEGWTYGDTPNAPTVEGNAEGANVTYKYKAKDAGDNEYTAKVPKAAGEYTVQATIAATAGYNEKDVTADFEIAPKLVELDWSDTEFTYSEGEAQAPEAEITNLEYGDKVEIIYNYKKADDDDSKYVAEKPEAAGNYVAKVAELSGEDADNYVLPEDVTADFTIAKEEIKPILEVDDWYYGDNPAEYVLTGNKGDAKVTYSYRLYEDESSEYIEGVPTEAGDYLVKATIAESDNYMGGEAVYDYLSIYKKTVKLEWSYTEFTYDGKAHVPTVTVTGTVNEDKLEAVVDGEETAAGEYTAEVTELTGKNAANYRLPYIDYKDFIIAKKTAELKWTLADTEWPNKDDKILTTIYDAKDQCPVAEVTNLEEADAGKVEVKVTGAASAVGTHTAEALKLTGSCAENYELPEEPTVEFEIFKGELDEAEVILNDWTYSENPNVPVVEGNVEGANVSIMYKEADADDSTYTTKVPVLAGKYTVKAVINASAGYNGKTVTKDFNINPKPATITVESASKVYGEENPEFTATVDGTVGNDKLYYTIIEPTDENAGEYEIDVELGDNPNYDITVVKGKYTIIKKDATITAENNDKVYGEEDPELTALVEGTVGDDELNYTLEREEGNDVGIYVISVKLGDNPNYDIAVTDGTFTITKKAATISAEDKSKVYGEDDPELTAVIEGSVGDDELNYTLEREKGNDAGIYVISVTPGENPNYDVAATDGTFTINKKAAVIKAEDKTRTYGEEDPELTAVVEGVLDGDELNYTLKRKPGNTIGTYAITVKPGDNPNYEVATERATFTIEKGKATITADDITKYFGQADPELTATVEGVAKGDALSYALQRKEGNKPGTYEIKVIPGVNRNYDVTAVNGTFTILDELQFVDVPVDSYYYESVYWAVEQEPQITSGVDETHFNPMGTCTRAQAVTFIWRANGCPVPNTANNPFTDVSEDDFYYQAVLWAVEKGITAGKTATTFAPNDPCTRAQVVTFIWRDRGSKKPSISESPFTDVTENNGYYDAVLWAVENNITSGVNENEFGVKKTCIRAQIVTFIMRAYGKE